MWAEDCTLHNRSSPQWSIGAKNELLPWSGNRALTVSVMLRGNHLCSSIIHSEFLSCSSLQSTSFLNLHQSIISLNSSIFTSFNGGEGPPHPFPSSALDMTFAKHLPCSHFFIWLKGNTVGQKIIFNNFLKTSNIHIIYTWVVFHVKA